MRADTNELISLEDTVLSEGLEALKERRRLRTITAEQEMAKRGAMIYEYDRRKRMAEGTERLARWYADLRKNIEAAQNRYRKERTLEAADMLSDVLDGMVRHGRAVPRCDSLSKRPCGGAGSYRLDPGISIPTLDK